MNPSNDPNIITPTPNGQPVVGGNTVPTATPVLPSQPTPVAPGSQQPQYTQPQTMSQMPGPVTQGSSNTTGIAWDNNVQKQKKQVWMLCTGSFVILVVGLILGFAALLGAALGVFAARKSRLISYKPGIVVGTIGTLLNAGLYLIAVLVK